MLLKTIWKEYNMDQVQLFQTEKFIKSYGRHQSFYPRYGWISRGFHAVKENPSFFSDDKAGIYIGVGKNMVSSIKYWLQAFKLIEPSDEDGAQRGDYKTTQFGEKLIGSNGLDFYLQDIRTLWILHWKLLEPVSSAVTWYAILNHMPSNELTLNKSIEFVDEFSTANKEILGNYTIGSIKKDVLCFFGMYSSNKKENFDEGLISPFSELGLITNLGGNKYEFIVGKKPSLTSEVIVWACYEYIRANNLESVTIRRLAVDENSPGRIFKLSGSSIQEYLENFQKNNPGSIVIDQTLGTSTLKIYKHEQLSLENLFKT